MAYRGQGQKVQKVMVQPINLIFRYLQNRSRIQVWLYEQINMRIEGCIIGCFGTCFNLSLPAKHPTSVMCVTSRGWCSSS
uniref:Small nuclear ribonucleoprotein E n=1 Tax=Canis lupus dingo TaxID=286419 RepID=A0A8C0JH57_CANLU